jgi:hypothetical protein
VDFIRFAAPNERCRVNPMCALNDPAYHLQTGSIGQQGKLVERLFSSQEWATAPKFKRHQKSSLALCRASARAIYVMHRQQNTFP